MRGRRRQAQPQPGFCVHKLTSASGPPSPSLTHNLSPSHDRSRAHQNNKNTFAKSTRVRRVSLARARTHTGVILKLNRLLILGRHASVGQALTSEVLARRLGHAFLFFWRGRTQQALASGYSIKFLDVSIFASKGHAQLPSHLHTPRRTHTVKGKPRQACALPTFQPRPLALRRHGVHV